MSQEFTSSRFPSRPSAALGGAQNTAFWARLLASVERRAVRVLILDAAPSEASALWAHCFPDAEQVLVSQAAQVPFANDSVFDVVIDALEQPDADAVATFGWTFPRLRVSGLHVFANVRGRGILGALDAGTDDMTMTQIRTVEFIRGLCVVRKRGGVDDGSGGVPAAAASRAKLETYRLSAEVVKLRAEIEREAEAVRRAIAAHTANVAEIHASTSWRVTAPLRWAGTQVLRVRSAVRLFRLMQERHQGSLGALRHGIRTLRQVGVHGLAQAATQAIRPPPDYAEWIRRYDTLDDEARQGFVKLVDAMPHKPLISILMPVYNPNLPWLARAIASLQAQIYPFWELCIADDASPDPACREALAFYASADRRIKVVYRTQNGHISAASNSALTLVAGEWTALMDQDDMLPEHALVWIADAINIQPDLRLIYSDEDKVDENDQRSSPYFKSDWNIDLFLSQNMFSHLGVYQTALLREVGGFREGVEGAQDYDLVLRCIVHIAPTQVVHIPRVLYHWRVHAESTAASTNAKPYAQIAGERALNEHFQRTGVKGRVEHIGHGYRAHYDLPSSQPLVSLIIPTRNAQELVRQCVDSITSLTTYSNYEIILVDNGSDDVEAVDYFNALARRPGFKVIRDDGEFNYSALNNKAVAQAAGEIVGLINNDIEVISPDWLSEMVSIALQPGVGAVGAKLWYPNGTLQHGGVVLGVGGVANHSHKGVTRGNPGYFGRANLIQSFSAVTAACLIVRKDHYEAVNGLDEMNLKVAFNDVDFCLRLREAGLRNVWTPYAELFHHESATRGSDTSPEKQERFNSEVHYMMARWSGLLDFDPAYNPNLTLRNEDFSLAWPPRVKPIGINT